MAEFTKLLGQRIRELRKEKTYSIEQLAERANISSKYLGEVERGESSVSAVILNEISTALETPLSKLTEFAEISYNPDPKKEILQYINSADHESLEKLLLFIKKFV